MQCLANTRTKKTSCCTQLLDLRLENKESRRQKMRESNSLESNSLESKYQPGADQSAIYEVKPRS